MWPRVAFIREESSTRILFNEADRTARRLQQKILESPAFDFRNLQEGLQIHELFPFVEPVE